jgi:hypothetical protein
VPDRNDPQRLIEAKLREAIDTLRVDAARVELWAEALQGFAQPVPDYDLVAKYRLGPAPNPGAKSG